MAVAIPDFIAGPIGRFSEVRREIYSRKTTIDLFFSGIHRFAFGLAKKVLIANNLGYVADRIFALQAGESSVALAWLGLACYTFQIYYDFFPATPTWLSAWGVSLGSTFRKTSINPIAHKM
jgi:alginate O-acetyltransferase complex protein AlgI